jgi:hypothetical protein
MKMSFTIPYDRYELPREGIHPAVVHALEDLGIIPTQWGPKPKMNIVFELLDERNSQGEPYVVKQRFTTSLHQKAKLFEAVRLIGGTDPRRDFDLEKLIGMRVELEIEYNTSQKDGMTYANVARIMQAKTTAEKHRERGIT